MFETPNSECSFKFGEIQLTELAKQSERLEENLQQVIFNTPVHNIICSYTGCGGVIFVTAFLVRDNRPSKLKRNNSI